MTAVHKRKRLTVPNPKQAEYTIEELFNEYWDPLHKVYYHSVRDWHLAEDLAQEALIRIWRYWPKIQWKKLGGVIAVIVNHVRFDYLSKNFDRPDKDFYEDVLEFERHDEGITDPVRLVINEEACEAIDAFLGALEARDREIFLDHYATNMKVDEICEKYKMKQGTVYVHLHRIRGEMAKCFDRLDLIPEGSYNTGALV